MKQVLAIAIFGVFLLNALISNVSYKPLDSKNGNEPISKRKVTSEKFDLCADVIGVTHPNADVSVNYVFDKQLYEYGCENLSQVKFWRDIMNLTKDMAIINVANYRHQVLCLPVKEWNEMDELAKCNLKDSVRTVFELDSSHSIYMTSGKKFFYDFDNAFKQIERGINAFIENGVDPWYAQSILLIESPNKLQKSNAGAYGPFQLMKGVARMYGLKVSRSLDERADFDRAAFAASSLIKNVCIPKTIEILDTLGISDYNQHDLWFRLLVMHTYHAGAGNVKAALNKIQPQQGGMDLIQQLWFTETKHFKSASQNYSQLVMAAHLEMNKRLGLEADNSIEISSN